MLDATHVGGAGSVRGRRRPCGGGARGPRPGRRSRGEVLQRLAPRAVVLIAGIALFTEIGVVQGAGGASELTPEYSAARLQLEIAGEIMTLRAREVAVGDFLDELAHRSGLEIVVEGPVEGRITAEFQAVSLSDALRRVLRDYDFALQYSPPYSSRSSVAGGNARAPGAGTLWLFSKTSPPRAGQPDAPQPDRSSFDSPVAARQARLLDGDPRVRRRAIAELGAFVGEEAIAPLSVAMSDDNKKVKLEAASALAAIGGDQAAAALAVALDDEDSFVRQEAVYALGAIGGETAARILERALHDRSKAVREAAIESFGDIGGETAAQALSIALLDGNHGLRMEALEVLGEIGGNHAVRLLRQALADHDARVRETAAEILAAVPDRE